MFGWNDAERSGRVLSNMTEKRKPLGALHAALFARLKEYGMWSANTPYGHPERWVWNTAVQTRGFMETLVRKGYAQKRNGVYTPIVQQEEEESE